MRDNPPFLSIYLGWITRPTGPTALPPDSPDPTMIVVAINDALLELCHSFDTPITRTIYHDAVFDAWLAFAAGRLKLPYHALDLSPTAPYSLAQCVTDTVSRVATELHESGTLTPPDDDFDDPADAELMGATPWGMASVFPLRHPFAWETLQTVLDQEPFGTDTVDAESKRIVERLLDCIIDQLEDGVPNGGIEAALLYHWLFLAATIADTPMVLLLQLSHHMMLVAEQTAHAVARLCAEHNLMTRDFVHGLAQFRADVSHLPASELMAAERIVPPAASTPLELVLVLDQSEDVEFSTFVEYRIERQLQAHAFSPSDLMAAAQVARDAGDVRPSTALMVADYLSLYLYMNDSNRWTSDAVPTLETSLEESEQEFIDRIATYLDALGEPQLAEWSRTDWNASQSRLEQAKRETLCLWEFPPLAFDGTLHMLPIVAVVIARTLLANPARVAPEHAPLIALAQRLMTLDDATGESSMLRYQERELVMALVRDGWPYAAVWEPEAHARAALGIPAERGPNDLGNTGEMIAWLRTSPTLFEVGLVCLGMAALLVSTQNPEDTESVPLLMRRWTKSIRQLTSDWLRGRGYVRVHDVLMAAFAEPEPAKVPGLPALVSG